MVHCQSMPPHIDTTTSDLYSSVDSVLPTSHHQHATASTADAATIAETTLSHTTVEPCAACDHCCSIQYVSLLTLFAATASDFDDKILQRTYFHASSVVVPQERPPRSV